MRWIVTHLSNNNWALCGQVVHASAMGAFLVGVIPISGKGGGAHEGLVIYIVAVDARVKDLEGAPKAWSRYVMVLSCCDNTQRETTK